MAIATIFFALRSASCLRLFLDLTNLLGGFVARLGEHLLEERSLSLLAAHLGHLFEAFVDLPQDPRLLSFPLLRLCLAFPQRRFTTSVFCVARLDRLEALLDGFLLALNPLLDLLNLSATLAYVLFRSLLSIEHHVLRLNLGLLADDLRFFSCFFEDPSGRGGCLLGLGRTVSLAHSIDKQRQPDADHDRCDDDLEKGQLSSLPGNVSNKARRRRPRRRY